MTLSSMTGFARADGDVKGVRWAWELRSVNGKGLDVRQRLPAGFEGLEPDVRARIAARLTRGTCHVSLSIARAAGTAPVRINEEALAAILDKMDELQKRIDAAPPRLDGILALRGVIEIAEPQDDPQTREEIEAAVLAGFEAALDALVESRRREGAAIDAVLRRRIETIETLVAEAERNPSRRVEAVRARLKQQLEELLEASPALDPQRLHQEAALLATKADIREELDRLSAHVAVIKAMLDGGGPVGRKLDFLAQELNREANTLCSKSNDAALTAVGVDLKVAIDQFREQIQNLE